MLQVVAFILGHPVESSCCVASSHAARIPFPVGPALGFSRKMNACPRVWIFEVPRKTYSHQSIFSVSLEIHPSQPQSPRSFLLAEPPIARHRPINVVFTPPYRTHSRKEGAMTGTSLAPGVWCVIESVKLGRDSAGARGRVLRAGAGCTRPHTMIAGTRCVGCFNCPERVRNRREGGRSRAPKSAR